MKNPILLKLYFLSVVGVLILLSSFMPKEESLWGIPITPKLLFNEGKLDVPVPEGEFNPEGGWEQTWKVWLPSRAKANNGSGYLKVKKEIDGNQSEINYKVNQLISEDDKWFHFTKAEITARKNLSSTPIQWETGAQFFTSPQSGSKNLTELNLFQKAFKGSLPDNESGNFTSSFTLFDVVQRMSLKGVNHTDFTLLDELDKVKRKHSISFSKETIIQFAGRPTTVRCYEGLGEGLLPMEYYVDLQGRLLLAISGMRVFILSPGCENEYKGKFDSSFKIQSMEQVAANNQTIPGEKKNPNILFITTDQQVWNSISALGNTYVNTPNLDRLVNAGVTFSKSYSPNPVCSPTRACWLTGLTSSENGVINNGLSIVEGIKTIGDVLTEKGYETVFAGKLHVGIPKSYKEEIPGFSKVLCEGIVGGKGTIGDQAVSSVAAGYLQNRDKNKPFYLSVNFLQPHDICNWILRNKENKLQIPYFDKIKNKLPPVPDNFKSNVVEPKAMKVPRNKEWDELNWRYYLWSYYRMVEEVDAEIGRVIAALESSGEMDNTVIIFNSDHGEGAGHHQSVTKNFPYDEACRVPFIISYPKEIKQGVLNKTHLVSGLDVVPTICDFAGVEPPANCKGISIRKIAAGRDVASRDFIVSEMNTDQGRMLRSSDYKLIAFRNDPNIMFFDMVNDPGETINLALNSKYQDLIEKHIEMLESWESNLNHAPNAGKPFKVRRK